MERDETALLLEFFELWDWIFLAYVGLSTRPLDCPTAGLFWPAVMPR